MSSRTLTEGVPRVVTCQDPDSMIVQLILASGSNAGITAPIQRGYYMVGRHPECQIRPKTRSVSRRHGLLHHDEAALRLIDLGSTSGTQINDKKIEPKRWHRLEDGDILRFGKTVFRVSVQPSAAFESNNKPRSEATPKPSMTSTSPPVLGVRTTATIVQGEAWHECDIASFLLSADEVAREQRYESIRQSAAVRHQELQNDSDSFEDTLIESDEPTLAAPKSKSKSKAKVNQPPRDVAGLISTTASAAAGTATTASVRGLSLTRAAARRSDAESRPARLLSGSLSFAKLADLQSQKVFLAVLVTLGILGYAGYSGYQVVQGPPVKLVDGID